MVEYDDLVDGILVDELSRFVGVPLDMGFIDTRKRRSAPVEVRTELLTLYEELTLRYETNKQVIRQLTRPVSLSRSRAGALQARSYVEYNRISNGIHRRLGRLRRGFLE
jgi:hypothetical protein